MPDHPDSRRLRYLMDVCIVDGFEGLSKDRYEYAFEQAEKHGREEPSEADELNGFRQMIDDSMAADMCSWRPVTCANPCTLCQAQSAAVAHEIARQLRERYGSSTRADWLDGVGAHP